MVGEWSARVYMSRPQPHTFRQGGHTRTGTWPGELLLAGVGALVGTAARYALGTWIDGGLSDASWSRGTLAINTLGSAVLGLLVGATEAWAHVDRPTQLLLDTGLLGGFTTFSRWATDAARLMATGPVLVGGVRAAVFLAGTVAAAALALALGLAVGGALGVRH